MMMETRRLLRSRSNRMIAGVAGGVAAAFNTDPLYIRLGFLLLSALNGLGVIIYIALWLLMPNEDAQATDPREQVRESINEMRDSVEQVVQRIRSMLAAPHN
jgi:phage shock protein C